MFQLTRPAAAEIERRIAAARDLPDASPPLVSLMAGADLPVPPGFAHDFCRTELGPGRGSFLDARHAMERWVQFDLGWVSVANTAAPIAPGETVAVLAHAAGLWSLNLSRILEIIDTPTRFGFLYSTTSMHVEEGQERFLIEFDEEHSSVTYLIEAVSRPRHPLARLAYPFVRTAQHRFQKESQQRMHNEVAAAHTRLP